MGPLPRMRLAQASYPELSVTLASAAGERSTNGKKTTSDFLLVDFRGTSDQYRGTSESLVR